MQCSLNAAKLEIPNEDFTSRTANCNLTLANVDYPFGIILVLPVTKLNRAYNADDHILSEGIGWQRRCQER